MTRTPLDNQNPLPADGDQTLVEPFARVLERHGLELRRGETLTLQVNLGPLCNLSCRHCHLEAGPTRTETMGRETMDQVVAFARRNPFRVIDLTGGAPELNPDLDYFLEKLAPLAERMMLRSNLTVLAARPQARLAELCRRLGVAIVASFPSLNAGQADSQRGTGVWQQTLDTLKTLNDLGYGEEGSGLELDLVANPTGAFLAAGQAGMEKKFRQDLQRRWGIVFNRLYTFANVPLGRYRRWLEASGNLEAYLRKLAESFNPATVEGLMCRSQLSVGWDGTLYDCDFNLASDLCLGEEKLHISQVERAPAPGTPIACGDHCYACTAGSGFT
jgi:radical SAM/Cys-rich protein